MPIDTKLGNITIRVRDIGDAAVVSGVDIHALLDGAGAEFFDIEGVARGGGEDFLRGAGGVDGWGAEMMVTVTVFVEVETVEVDTREVEVVV